MRLLHLYNVFGAPTERAWLHTALGMAARGHQVTCGHETLDPQAPPTPGLRLMQLPRVTVDSVDDVARQMDALAERAPLIDEAFDAVHGHFGPRLLWAAPYLERGIRTIVSLYGYDASRLLRDPAWPARYRWAAERGGILAVLSAAMQQRMAALGISNVRVVRLGIELENWPYDPAPPEDARFVFVGRLTAKKAPLDAIRAAARLPGVRLDLIGGGPLEDACWSAVAQLGVGGRVRLLGPQTPAQIRAHLRGAAALVLPSVVAPDGDEEGTPVVLMEAQAMGLPCVTTHHAGNAEVLPPDAQRFVVPEGDVAKLAAAMEAVLALSPAQRGEVQRAGRAWIEARHDVRKIVEQYESLYRGN